MNDIDLAKKYIEKADSAFKLGHEFTLTFNQYKKLMLAKRCHYTGIKLNKFDDTKTMDKTYKAFVVTLDRVDNAMGYTAENTVACAKCINTFKGNIENPNNSITAEIAYKFLTKWLKVHKQ